MWCNSAALSYFGYDPAQETGILREKSCFDAIGKLPAVKDEVSLVYAGLLPGRPDLNWALSDPG